MKILVTGGAGFIGSHTAERLVTAGHRVRVVDDLSTGSLANLAAVESEIELVQMDVRDAERLADACRGIDRVLHLAAVASVVKSIDEPLAAHEVNASGSLNVIEAARRGGAGRVILASSAAVYGNDPELPKRENSPTLPQSPYAWQKLCGEFYGRFFGETYGIEFVALRYFNVYGPRQDPDSPYSGVLSIFTSNAAQGRPLVIDGDGRQTRDFIYVKDVAEINARALEAAGPLPGAVNVSTNKETSILDAARIIMEAAGSDAVLQFSEERPGDIRRSFADNSLMMKSFDYTPQVDITAGLPQLVDEFRAGGPAPQANAGRSA